MMTRWLIALRSCCVLALATSPLTAATLEVPNQFPTLQAAINAAQPNDVVIVHGGTHDPITINKPLTIVGDPLATIDNSAIPFSDPVPVPAIRIQGSGTGYVRLIGLKTSGTTDGSFYSTTAEGILATGISQLLVEDCEVNPALWAFLSGIGVGKPGIDCSAVELKVVRSKVRGGRTDTDDCDYPSAPNSAPAIQAPNATVIAIDSDIRGGDGAAFCFSTGNCPVCPCANLGGLPGRGVVAQRLFYGGPKTVILGGIGKPVLCGSNVIYQQSNGSPSFTTGPTIYLGASLTGNGPLELGTLMTLTATNAAPNTLLLLGAPGSPLFVGAAYGWLFMNPVSMFQVTIVNFTQFGLNVPNSPALMGAEVVAQTYHSTTKLSVPYFSVIHP